MIYRYQMMSAWSRRSGSNGGYPSPWWSPLKSYSFSRSGLYRINSQLASTYLTNHCSSSIKMRMPQSMGLLYGLRVRRYRSLLALRQGRLSLCNIQDGMANRNLANWMPSHSMLGMYHRTAVEYIISATKCYPLVIRPYK